MKRRRPRNLIAGITIGVGPLGQGGRKLECKLGTVGMVFSYLPSLERTLAAQVHFGAGRTRKPRGLPVVRLPKSKTHEVLIGLFVRHTTSPNPR